MSYNEVLGVGPQFSPSFSTPLQVGFFGRDSMGNIPGYQSGGTDGWLGYKIYDGTYDSITALVPHGPVFIRYWAIVNDYTYTYPNQPGYNSYGSGMDSLSGPVYLDCSTQEIIIDYNTGDAWLALCKFTYPAAPAEFESGTSTAIYGAIVPQIDNAGGWQLMRPEAWSENVLPKGGMGFFPAFDGSDGWYTTLTATYTGPFVPVVTGQPGLSFSYQPATFQPDNGSGGPTFEYRAPTLPGYTLTLVSQSDTERVWATADGLNQIVYQLSTYQDLTDYVSAGSYDHYFEVGQVFLCGNESNGGASPVGLTTMTGYPNMPGHPNPDPTYTTVYVACTCTLVTLGSDGSLSLVSQPIREPNTPFTAPGQIVLGAGRFTGPCNFGGNGFPEAAINSMDLVVSV